MVWEISIYSIVNTKNIYFKGIVVLLNRKCVFWWWIVQGTYYSFTEKSPVNEKSSGNARLCSEEEE